jgi:eukaryotic-like serine/threonine-protein kinase
VADLRDCLQEDLADRYRLERELGRGGMATVFLAQDLRHRRHVALKVLTPELATAVGVERFQREIHLAASLQHPHILPVHDSGESAGLLWYTMPYVEGQSLRERLREETRLGIDEAVTVAWEVADALECAHAAGIIHRDVKPENILLCRGHALVGDFGIARAMHEAGETLTQSGLIVGTPAYMSPEQGGISSHSAGPRSDIYSLGCVLYEMLTGERPFAGPTPHAIIARRLLEAPFDVRLARPGVPEPLAAVVMRALATEPGDRYATAAEFGRALLNADRSPTTRAVGVHRGVPKRGARALRRLWRLRAVAIPLLIALGLFAVIRWDMRQRAPSLAPGPIRVAVLPFENIGDSADGYFADGITDAVRDKLTSVSGVEVIASASSRQYRKSTKAPQQIGRELAVQYLLTGRVRWAKRETGPSRVQVRPELIDVASGAERWGEAFDAALTDVFEVESEIAARVVVQLDLALGSNGAERATDPPTDNLAAYDAFLRGRAAMEKSASDIRNLSQAEAAFSQAVALDSSFAPAWARLARVLATMYFLGPPTEVRAQACRRAAERAVALAPAKPDGYLALGEYYGYVLKDYAKVFIQDSTALAFAPGDAELIARLAYDEVALGRWESARPRLEQAARLDPRSDAPGRVLGQALFFTRRYREAAEVFDRQIRSDPSDLVVRHFRAMVALAEGDLTHAQTVLRGAPREMTLPSLVFFASTWDLYWMLDSTQRSQLLRLSASAFNGNRGSWGLVFTETLALQGSTARSRAYADSARLAYEEQLRASPDDAWLHAARGLTLAYQARQAEAIQEGLQAVALARTSTFPQLRPYLQHQLARIYILAGETEKALDHLEPLLKLSYHLSPGWLRIDPTFAPLRGNPRFDRLVNGT